MPACSVLHTSDNWWNQTDLKKREREKRKKKQQNNGENESNDEFSCKCAIEFNRN